VTPEAIDRLADEFFAAIERGDLEAVAGYYADDVVVWHNVTRRDQTREENLRLLRHLSGRIADWRYEEVRRDCFPGGFVQRHLLRGTNAAGEEVELPVCLVPGRRPDGTGDRSCETALAPKEPGIDGIREQPRVGKPLQQGHAGHDVTEGRGVEDVERRALGAEASRRRLVGGEKIDHGEARASRLGGHDAVQVCDGVGVRILREDGEDRERDRHGPGDARQLREAAGEARAGLRVRVEVAKVAPLAIAAPRGLDARVGAQLDVDGRSFALHVDPTPLVEAVGAWLVRLGQEVARQQDQARARQQAGAAAGERRALLALGQPLERLRLEAERLGIVENVAVDDEVRLEAQAARAQRLDHLGQVVAGDAQVQHFEVPRARCGGGGEQVLEHGGPARLPLHAEAVGHRVTDRSDAKGVRRVRLGVLAIPQAGAADHVFAIARARPQLVGEARVGRGLEDLLEDHLDGGPQVERAYRDLADRDAQREAGEGEQRPGAHPAFRDARRRRRSPGGRGRGARRS
jgi:hypothetical protein